MIHLSSCGTSYVVPDGDDQGVDEVEQPCGTVVHSPCEGPHDRQQPGTERALDLFSTMSESVICEFYIDGVATESGIVFAVLW